MKNFLFNPFNQIAGAKAFLAGIAGIIITGVLCLFSHTHLDGILDIHFSGTLDNYIIIADGLINLVIIVIVFSLLGIMLAGFRFRFIDLLGTMSLARLPLIIPPLAALIMPQQKMLNYFLYIYMKTGTPVIITNWDIAVFVIASFLSILAVIWSVALMWNAFRICMNINGPKIVLAFILGLILAEIISKLIFYLLNESNFDIA